eukprot:scaffold44964_cov62-Phaeocystis_antarctica.AAC.2
MHKITHVSDAQQQTSRRVHGQLSEPNQGSGHTACAASAQGSEERRHQVSNLPSPPSLFARVNMPDRQTSRAAARGRSQRGSRAQVEEALPPLNHPFAAARCRSHAHALRAGERVCGALDRDLEGVAARDARRL